MPVFNKIKLGVRSKIFTASLVIALMLLLSGALAFFELGRMSRYISDFISNSILSVDLTRNLLNTSERYHSDLFRQIGGDGLLAQPETIPAEEFEAGMERLYKVLASDSERQMADSVRGSGDRVGLAQTAGGTHRLVLQPPPDSLHQAARLSPASVRHLAECDY